MPPPSGPPNQPKGPSVLGKIAEGLSGLRKPDRGISEDNIVDPAKITKSNTLLSEHFKLLANIQQEHVAIGRASRYREEDIKTLTGEVGTLKKKQSALKTTAAIVKKLHALESKKSALKEGESLNENDAKRLKKLQDFSKHSKGMVRDELKAAGVLRSVRGDDNKLTEVMTTEKLDLNEVLKRNSKEQIVASRSTDTAKDSLLKLNDAQSKAVSGGSLLQKQVSATAVQMTQWAASKFPEVMAKWGEAGKVAANNYVATGKAISDSNKGTAKTFIDLTKSMYQVQSVIGSVALEGATLGYSLKESSDVVSTAMRDIAIDSKGAIDVSDFKTMGEDALLYSRILGVDTADTVKFFQHELKSLNKTEKEAASDLMMIKMASDKLKNANGGAILTVKEFTNIITEASSKSKSAYVNINTLTSSTLALGSIMKKAGLSVEQTKAALSGFTNFLTNPDDAISFISSNKMLEDMRAAALQGEEALTKHIEDRFKDQLDAADALGKRQEKLNELKEFGAKITKKDENGNYKIGAYSAQAMMGEKFGAGDEGINQKLQAIKDTYITGGAEEAGTVIKQQIPGITAIAANAIVEAINSGDMKGAIAKFKAEQTPEKVEAAQKSAKEQAKATGVYAGGIDKLPGNIWDAFLANSEVMAVFGGLSGVAFTVVKIAAAISAFNQAKAFFQYGKTFFKGPAASGLEKLGEASLKTLVDSGANAAAEATKAAGSGANAAAEATKDAAKAGKTVLTEAAEAASKTAAKVGAETAAETAAKVGAEKVAETAAKVGAEKVAETAAKVGAEKVAETAAKSGLGALAKGAIGGGAAAGIFRLGEGLMDYSKATTKEEKRDVVGKTTGGVIGAVGGAAAGTAGGAAIGTALGTLLAPATGGISLLAGPWIGGIIGGAVMGAVGDHFGSEIGEGIAHNSDIGTDESKPADVITKATDFQSQAATDSLAQLVLVNGTLKSILFETSTINAKIPDRLPDIPATDTVAAMFRQSNSAIGNTPTGESLQGPYSNEYMEKAKAATGSGNAASNNPMSNITKIDFGSPNSVGDRIAMFSVLVRGLPAGQQPIA